MVYYYMQENLYQKIKKVKLEQFICVKSIKKGKKNFMYFFESSDTAVQILRKVSVTVTVWYVSYGNEFNGFFPISKKEVFTSKITTNRYLL